MEPHAYSSHWSSWYQQHPHQRTEKPGENHDRFGAPGAQGRYASSDKYPILCSTLLLTAIAVLKKPFISLCRMLLYPQDYWGADYDNSPGGIPELFDFRSRRADETLRQSQREQVEAQRVARAILEYNGLLASVTSVAPKTDGWDIPGHGRWNEPGVEMINIQQFMHEEI